MTQEEEKKYIEGYVSGLMEGAPSDLKERELNIVTERVVTPNGKRVASYKLVD